MIVIALVFALLYGLAEFSAVSNLLALPQYYAALGIAHAVPWPVLVAGVVIPPLLFALALLLGRGRPLLDRAILLAVGLAATHALALSGVSLVSALQPALG